MPSVMLSYSSMITFLSSSNFSRAWFSSLSFESASCMRFDKNKKFVFCLFLTRSKSLFPFARSASPSSWTLLSTLVSNYYKKSLRLACLHPLPTNSGTSRFSYHILYYAYLIPFISSLSLASSSAFYSARLAYTSLLSSFKSSTSYILAFRYSRSFYNSAETYPSLSC